jgi:hypothetical protein
VKDNKPLIEEIISPAVSSSKPSPSSFQQAKQDRAQRTLKTVGGGFMKRDGTTPDTVFKPKTTIEVKQSETTQPSADINRSEEPMPSLISTQPKPANAFEFQRQWQRFQAPHDRWVILQVSTYSVKFYRNLPPLIVYITRDFTKFFQNFSGIATISVNSSCPSA